MQEKIESLAEKIAEIQAALERNQLDLNHFKEDIESRIEGQEMRLKNLRNES